MYNDTIHALACAMLAASEDGDDYPVALWQQATPAERERAETMVRAWYNGRASVRH